jgi:hypothetical protein
MRCHNCNGELTGQWTRLKISVARTVQISDESEATFSDERDALLCDGCADRASVGVSFADHASQNLLVKIMLLNLRGK